MIHTDIIQQSVEWLQMRVGCVTGSRVADVQRKLKVANRGRKAGEYAQPHYDYLQELVVERLTGRASDHGIGNLKAVEWGIEQEPIARGEYELRTDLPVTPIGLASHPQMDWFMSSPDALVGDDGLLEIKCLASGNHLEIIQNGVVPAEYIPQMMAEMACAERKWCDFVAFDPRMPKNLRLFVARLHRDDDRLAQMEAEIRVFLEDVLLELGKLAKYSESAGIEPQGALGVTCG